MINNKLIYTYVILSIFSITLLIAFLVKCQKKTCSAYSKACGGKKCLCNGPMRTFGTCKDEDTAMLQYDNGNNENQDMAKIQMEQGGPKWMNNFDFSNY